MSNEADCRTAPATQGLLITKVMFLLKITKVTTEHQKWPKNNHKRRKKQFLDRKGKKPWPKAKVLPSPSIIL